MSRIIHRPICPVCGPLTLDERGRIIAHHCKEYSDLPDHRFAVIPIRVDDFAGYVLGQDPYGRVEARPAPTRLSIRALLRGASTNPLTAGLGLLLLALCWAIGWL